MCSCLLTEACPLGTLVHTKLPSGCAMWLSHPCPRFTCICHHHVLLGSKSDQRPVETLHPMSSKDPTMPTTITTNPTTPQGPLLDLKKLHSRFHCESKSRSSMLWSAFHRQVSQRSSIGALRGGPSQTSSVMMKELLRPGRLRMKTAMANPSALGGGSVKRFLSCCFDSQLSRPPLVPSPLSLLDTSSTSVVHISPSTS